MKTVLNPAYQYLSADLKTLESGNYTPLKTFCNKRNTVELIEVGGKKMVLKKYKRANFFKGLIYSFFRKTKARRAYEHAMRLLDEGFDTPAPVAYCEISRCGLFHKGFFLAEYSPLPSLLDVYYTQDPNSQEHKDISAALAQFTLRLHLNGIQPLDYNLSNILFEKLPEGKEDKGDHGEGATAPTNSTEGKSAEDKTQYPENSIVNGYHFMLIDINRMAFDSVPDLKDAMLPFFQLNMREADYHNLLEPYVRHRGFNLNDAITHIATYRQHRLNLYKAKGLVNPKYRHS